MWYTLYEQANMHIYVTIVKARISLLFSHFKNDKNVKNHIVYMNVDFSSGHQTSSRSSLIVWLAWFCCCMWNTQYLQNSVHGILFLRQLHLPSHPHSASALYQVQYCLMSWRIQAS